MEQKKQNTEGSSLSSHGAGVVCINEESVLLVQINYGPFRGSWILPGGMCEPGEHPHEAAKREVYEETNLHVTELSLMAMRHRIKQEGMNNTYWVFAGKLKKNKNSKLAWPESEIIEARFWNISDVFDEKSIRPQTKVYIKAAIKKEQMKPMQKLKGDNDDFGYFF